MSWASQSDLNLRPNAEQLCACAVRVGVLNAEESTNNKPSQWYILAAQAWWIGVALWVSWALGLAMFALGGGAQTASIIAFQFAPAALVAPLRLLRKPRLGPRADDGCHAVCCWLGLWQAKRIVTLYAVNAAVSHHANRQTSRPPGMGLTSAWRTRRWHPHRSLASTWHGGCACRCRTCTACSPAAARCYGRQPPSSWLHITRVGTELGSSSSVQPPWCACIKLTERA